MKKSNRILISALLAVGLLGGCALADQEKQPAEQMTVTPSADSVEASAQQVAVPESLAAFLEKGGADIQTLEKLECQQLVTVSVTGTKAQVCLYILKDHQWHAQETLSCSGFVGKKGATDHKREGDLATPKGLFHIGDAFYRDTAPQTGLHMFRITQDTYWVDDPDSVYYNKRIEGVSNKDWRSAEHMIEYATAYEYGFVVDYNMEAVPGAGSAIFFHVGYGETAGCIATDREFVLGYLAALDKNCNPYILIA